MNHVGTISVMSHVFCGDIGLFCGDIRLFVFCKYRVCNESCRYHIYICESVVQVPYIYMSHDAMNLATFIWVMQVPYIYIWVMSRMWMSETTDIYICIHDWHVSCIHMYTRDTTHIYMCIHISYIHMYTHIQSDTTHIYTCIHICIYGSCHSFTYVVSLCICVYICIYDPYIRMYTRVTRLIYTYVYHIYIWVLCISVTYVYICVYVSRATHVYICI